MVSQAQVGHGVPEGMLDPHLPLTPHTDKPVKPVGSALQGQPIINYIIMLWRTYTLTSWLLHVTAHRLL